MMKRCIALTAIALSISPASAQVYYIDHSKDAAWSQLLAWAIAQKFEFQRDCYPKEQPRPIARWSWHPRRWAGSSLELSRFMIRMIN